MNDERFAGRLRERLLKNKLLRRFEPFDTGEDAAHDVIARLLEQASKQRTSLESLVTNRETFRKALVAERSRLRRQYKRLAALATDMHAELVAVAAPADAPSPQRCAELLESIVQAIDLNEAEKQFLNLRYVRKLDYKAIRSAMGMDMPDLYRLHHRLKAKLVHVPSIAERLIE